jgi:hypothetical protein
LSRASWRWRNALGQTVSAAEVRGRRSIAQCRCPCVAYHRRMNFVVRTEQLQQMADAEPGKAMVCPCASDAHWIEFRLVD